MGLKDLLDQAFRERFGEPRPCPHSHHTRPLLIVLAADFVPTSSPAKCRAAITIRASPSPSMSCAGFYSSPRLGSPGTNPETGMGVHVVH